MTTQMPTGKVIKFAKFGYLVAGDDGYMISAVPTDSVVEACRVLSSQYAGRFSPASYREALEIYKEYENLYRMV